MVLEFDCEVALLQTALQNIQIKHGLISSLGRNKIIGAIKDFRISVEDIIAIREDDGVSAHQAEHRDRKLVAGLLCTVFKEKLDFWEPGECFESLNDVYPPLGWNFFLEIIKVFDWADYFLECIEAVHPEALLQCTQAILSCLWDISDHNNVTILIRLLPLLTQPKHFQESNNLNDHSETSGMISLEEYKTQLKTTVELLLEHLNRKQEWSQKITVDYFTCLFSTLDTITQRFLLGSPNSPKYQLRQSSNDGADKPITLENLEEIYQNLCGRTSISESNSSGVADLEAIDWILLKCFHLAYESLLLLDYCELSNLLSRKSARSERSADLRVCFIVLEQTCRRASLSCAGRSEKLICTVQLVQQRLESLRVTLQQSIASACEDIIAIVDNRHKRYEECIDHIIETPILVGHSEFLECLKRNSSLLTVEHAHELLAQVGNGKNIASTSLELVQEIVLSAFASWSWPVQQEFQKDCLVRYKDSILLLTKDFEEEMTMTFNKMINADVKTNNTLSLQMGRLCLQSPRRTISQAVFQAMNSKAQGNILIQLLSSVWCTCRYRESPTDATMLCEVLNDVLLNYCLSEMQFQNLKTFIRKLLKAKLDQSFEVPFIDSTLVSRVELVQTCILPYLDQWNPGRGCRLTLFGIQLLQMVLSSDSPNKSPWLRQFKPCVFLCYLGLIIGQCKLVHRENEQVDWIQMKSQAVATLVKLTTLIGGEPPAYITKMETIWLCEKLQAVDESLTFYFTDLCEHFDIDLSPSESGDALEGIFEFSCCSDANAWLARPWFGKAVVDLGRAAKIRVLGALKTILPFSLPEEWKRITLLLDYVLREEQLVIPLNSCLAITSQDGKTLCNLASLLINAIFACNAAGTNVQYMMQCFSVVVKDHLTTLEESNEINDAESPSIVAELFVRVCLLMGRLPTKPVEEGKVLLMELSQRRLKKGRPGNDQVNKVMIAAASKLHASTFQNNLLKALTQDC